LACFRVARVCQRQLGFLVLQDMEFNNARQAGRSFVLIQVISSAYCMHVTQFEGQRSNETLESHGGCRGRLLCSSPLAPPRPRKSCPQLLAIFINVSSFLCVVNAWARQQISSPRCKIRYCNVDEQMSAPVKWTSQLRMLVYKWIENTVTATIFVVHVVCVTTQIYSTRGGGRRSGCNRHISTGDSHRCSVHHKSRLYCKKIYVVLSFCFVRIHRCQSISLRVNSRNHKSQALDGDDSWESFQSLKTSLQPCRKIQLVCPIQSNSAIFWCHAMANMLDAVDASGLFKSVALKVIVPNS